jgi:hypothetical protein
MKTSKTVSGFTLTQRNGSRKVREIEIQVSQNNADWNSLGTFTLQENSVPQNIDLPSTQSFRYFKLVFKSAFDFTQNAAMAEVSVY